MTTTHAYLDARYGPVTGHAVTTAPLEGYLQVIGGTLTIPAGTAVEIRTPDVDWCRYVSVAGRTPMCVAPDALAAATAAQR